MKSALAHRRRRPRARVGPNRHGHGGEARTLCTPCHAFPPPNVLPEAPGPTRLPGCLIHSDLPQPTRPMGTSAPMIVLPPDYARVLRYYRANAPERLAAPAPWPAADPLTFVKQTFNSCQCAGRSGHLQHATARRGSQRTPGAASTNMRRPGHDRPALQASTTLDVFRRCRSVTHVDGRFDRDGLKDLRRGSRRPSVRLHRGSFVLLRGAREGDLAH